MKVHGSARKHGVDPDDAVHAAEHAVFVSDLDEDSPARQLRLGFDATDPSSTRHERTLGGADVVSFFRRRGQVDWRTWPTAALRVSPQPFSMP